MSGSVDGHKPTFILVAAISPDELGAAPAP